MLRYAERARHSNSMRLEFTDEKHGTTVYHWYHKVLRAGNIQVGTLYVVLFTEDRVLVEPHVLSRNGQPRKAGTPADIFIRQYSSSWRPSGEG